MIWFFVAVIMFIILGVKIHGEKVTHKKNEEEFKKQWDEANKDREAFQQEYAASYELEAEMRKKSIQIDSDTLELRKRIVAEAGIKPTDDMIFYALLAQKGKLSQEESYGGFNTTMGPSEYEAPRPYMIIERKFMIWYDKELRNHGMKHKLLFLKEDDKMAFYGGAKYELAKWVGDDPDIMMGKYFWTPLRKSSQVGSSVVIVW